MTNPSKHAPPEAADIASIPVQAMLAELRVDPALGLTAADVETRRRDHGYNEVSERKEHPIAKFLGKGSSFKRFPTDVRAFLYGKTGE